jgi:ACR3 family arsenite efflux pump ArsB
MFTLSFLLVNISVLTIPKAQQLLTATGNNFRAIAVAIGVFGLTVVSLRWCVGPLVGSQHSLHLQCCIWFRKKYYSGKYIEMIDKDV